MKAFVKILGITVITCCIFNVSINAMSRRCKPKPTQHIHPEPTKRGLRSQTRTIIALGKQNAALKRALGELNIALPESITTVRTNDTETQLNVLQEQQAQLTQLIKNIFVKAACDGTDSIVKAFLNTQAIKIYLSSRTINLAFFAAVKNEQTTILLLLAKEKAMLVRATIMISLQYAAKHNLMKAAQTLLDISASFQNALS